MAALITRAMQDPKHTHSGVSTDSGASSVSVWKGWSTLRGKSWRMAKAFRDVNPKILNLEGVATVGSTKRLHQGRASTQRTADAPSPGT